MYRECPPSPQFFPDFILLKEICLLIPSPSLFSEHHSSRVTEVES